MSIILKEISKLQYKEGIKAYFKGGTSIYKRTDNPLRFSEDIDLTLDTEGLSRSQIKKQLNILIKSFENIIPRAEELRDIEFTNRSSVQAVYKYPQVIQGLKPYIIIEATSFTVSEPTEEIEISPLLFKEDKFKIKSIELKRVFTDKVFSIQNNTIRGNVREVSKHLFDIFYLLESNKEIKQFLDNPELIEEYYNYTIMEEKVRMDSRISEYIETPVEISRNNLDYQLAVDILAEYTETISELDLEKYIYFYNQLIQKTWKYAKEIYKEESNGELLWTTK